MVDMQSTHTIEMAKLFWLVSTRFFFYKQHFYKQHEAEIGLFLNTIEKYRGLDYHSISKWLYSFQIRGWG